MEDRTDTPATEPILLDEREAATRLRISARGLWQLRADREIAFVKIGARILYRPRDLEAFIERKRRPANDDADAPGQKV